VSAGGRRGGVARTPAIVRSAAAILPVLVVLLPGCGKMGPPLPPIIRVPARPSDFTATRRGDVVHLQFVVPAANADGSKPANVERVELYAVNASADVREADILRSANRIATVVVNPPPDPDRPAPERPAAPGDSPRTDQGGTARATEQLGADILASPAVDAVPSEPAGDAVASEPAGDAVPSEAEAPEEPDAAEERPAPSETVPTRVYLAVPVGARGRTGPASVRAVVPLVPAPPAPADPALTYDETGITVAWTPAAADVGYHVYEIARGPDGDVVETRLTKEPVSVPRFEDSRVEWGGQRCYTVRAARTAAGAAIESEAPDQVCTTMVDTFAPAPPTGLTAVASAGAVSLIWDASPAADLAGYFVLRGVPGGQMIRVTPSAVPETSFRDTVPTGTRFAYAVQAVDASGNVSPPSVPVQETSR
jgi:hypothetical protein